MKKILMILMVSVFLIGCTLIEFPEDATGDYKKEMPQEVGIPNLGDKYGAEPSGACRETNTVRCMNGNVNRRFECENGPARWRQDEACDNGCVDFDGGAACVGCMNARTFVNSTEGPVRCPAGSQCFDSGDFRGNTGCFECGELYCKSNYNGRDYISKAWRDECWRGSEPVMPRC